jgi:hypothetical protein
LPRSPFQLWRSLPTTKKILRPSPGNRANPASNQTCFQRSNDVFGLRSASARIEEETVRSLHLRTAQIKDRMSRLTDAYLDGVVDKTTFEDKKSKMLTELQEVEESLRSDVSGRALVDRVAEMVELAAIAYFQYEQAFPEGKRDLLQILTSNRRADSKNVVLTLHPPFSINREPYPNCKRCPATRHRSNLG